MSVVCACVYVNKTSTKAEKPAVPLRYPQRLVFPLYLFLPVSVCVCLKCHKSHIKKLVLLQLNFATAFDCSFHPPSSLHLFTYTYIHTHTHTHSYSYSYTTYTSTSTTMSKRKGMSLEEKRRVILNIYHSTRVSMRRESVCVCVFHQRSTTIEEHGIISFMHTYIHTHTHTGRLQPEGDRVVGDEARGGLAEVGRFHVCVCMCVCMYVSLSPSPAPSTLLPTYTHTHTHTHTYTASRT
jgi:hypothetical protein